MTVRIALIATVMIALLLGAGTDARGRRPTPTRRTNGSGGAA